jgi:hypothetical protein
MWNGTRMNATVNATSAPASQAWLASIGPPVARHATHAASAPPPASGTSHAGNVRARRAWSSDHRISAREFIAASIAADSGVATRSRGQNDRSARFAGLAPSSAAERLVQRLAAMRVMVLGVVVAVFPACNGGGGGGDCIDDVCADASRTTPLPGLCQSSAEFDQRCSFGASIGVTTPTRDDLIDCRHDLKRHNSGDPRTLDVAQVAYSYDASGQLTRISTQQVIDEGKPVYGAWRFSDQRVTDGVTVFDRNAFALLPALGSELASPRAELGAISTSGTAHGTLTYHWELDGAFWIRTALADDATVVEVSFYELDSRERIVSIRRCTDCDRAEDAVTVETFRYDGDRLTHHVRSSPPEPFSARSYEYDRGGNLTAIQFDGGPWGSGREVYDYSPCFDHWEGPRVASR